MKVTTLHRYRTFVICCGALAKGHCLVNPNTTAGEYNQLFYGFLGEGAATNPEGTQIQLTQGVLTDLSAFKGQEITYHSDADVSMWAAFNPIFPNTKLHVSIIDQPSSLELLDNEVDTYIVPLQGFVQVNGKTIEELLSGRLLVGKKGSLNVPENSLCAVVKTYLVDVS